MTTKIEYVVQYQYLTKDKWVEDILSFKPFDSLETAKEKLTANKQVKENIRVGYKYRIVARETIEGDVVFSFGEEDKGGK